MDFDGFDVATNTSGLDVDDLGSAKFDSVAGAVCRDDAFIQANRCLNIVGKLCVTEHVFFVDWLLN